MDTRNVRDKYKGMWEEDIKLELSNSYSGFVPIFVNIEGDFNKASGVRNANWFNSGFVFMTGRKKWDRRGAVGAGHYTRVYHWPDPETLIVNMRALGYSIVAAEITPNAKPLPGYEWPAKVAVLFGEENLGLSQEVLDLCDDVVYIPARGSVRSLNVSTTSGIMMYDFCVKRGLKWD